MALLKAWLSTNQVRFKGCLQTLSTISDAIIKVSNFVGESVPVTDELGILRGVVTESDLFLEYLKVQDQISEIEKD